MQRKKMSLAEQITATNKEIEKTEELLSKLKIKKKDLEKKKIAEDLNKLYSIVKASGKSIEEAQAILSERIDK